VARNRKRAKERRSRRPPGTSPSLPGVATARAQREEETPDAIEHAAPDVELAEAQLALGRPELAEESEADIAEFEAEAGGGGDRGGGPPVRFDSESGGGGELTPSPAGAPARSRMPGGRLIHFLQGSWRELQRVQWPDRRQVMQATGVVIGFVIVAGVYLGVADTLAGKLVTFILK
jgi:preprotein translocase subunit SecE